MSFTLARFVLLHSRVCSEAATTTKNNGGLISTLNKRKFTSTAIPRAQNKTSEELLVVVGGGAAGVYGAIRAKTLAPNLNVVVIEKGKPLSKVKISGGGRCNVTNGHCVDNKMLAENYPRGHKELRGAFFNVHGPVDTMSWFSEHGVRLKIEDDGRVFPVSNSSSTIIDCLMSESTRLGVSLQTGKAVITASPTAGGKFLLGIEKRTFSSPEYVEADYLLIASGNSKQGYSLASQLGHSIVDPVPSLFTFKIEDPRLADLSGITFPIVKATLKIENARRNIPQLTQVGPVLVTHWGFSGPAILRLSAWGACVLSRTLIVDFTPDVHIEDLKSILTQHKNRFAKQKLSNSYPSEFGLVKRFWIYILGRQGLLGDTLWASISKNSLISLAHMLKHCNFYVTGKSQYKDEFVTAGGVPLSEISMNTMESKIQSHLFFAGEVLNVDGITGGFNFQNAWDIFDKLDGPDEEAAADGYERPDNTVLNLFSPLFPVTRPSWSRRSEFPRPADLCLTAYVNQ
ncbi:hypothetical protein L3X38_020313 [Prunus dulcis]|uniref:FAD/NAD(P)-binding oxidoreductase family protein n=1 Tax=Prunus dulcis TaxID=3755 RepID=A0AAD4WCT7_PRUDU|nr:hypothetical protein L3X38_020313 [Prunus dulcis]